MFLVRLIYVSEFKTDKSSGELKNIIENSKLKNKELSITGILCADGDYYLQCLEGARDVINSLYGKIISDDRHKNVTLLEYTEVTERTFSNWYMNMIVFNATTDKLIFKYSVDENFNPYKFSAKTAFNFLKEVSLQNR
ncbi:MAG: BLUF domain-containing protein [Bdellovibrionales bacterium]|nr:BLUF domain-containing protein [Bdellovibrionales bacterium]